MFPSIGWRREKDAAGGIPKLCGLFKLTLEHSCIYASFLVTDNNNDVCCLYMICQIFYIWCLI